MTDLVERLRNRDSICMGGLFTAIPLLLEAATALEAKDAEIAALRTKHFEADDNRCYWQDRAKTAERKLAEARAALKPFAAVAEHDIAGGEADDDYFRPMTNYNHAPRLRVGHLRAARAVIEKE